MPPSGSGPHATTGSRIAADHTNDLKWLTVIILGLLTQISIGLVHLERIRAFTTALVVFSSAAVVALGIVALQEYPFYGAFKLSPAPIAQFQSWPDTVTPQAPEPARN